jgi:hypothetical protein
MATFRMADSRPEKVFPGGSATPRESDNKTAFRKLLDTRFPVGVQEGKSYFTE